MEFRDYETGIAKNLATGEERPAGLPKSNVLYFDLDRDAWCCIRPSGTEPKVKYYIGVKGENREDAGRQLEALTAAVSALVQD